MPPLPKFEIDPAKFVSFTYTNWRGETGPRRVQPLEMYFGKVEHYPTARWLLLAWDLDKAGYRNFDITKITGWSP
jgi:predicted DNA-binding transcriptional regulator YafY